MRVFACKDLDGACGLIKSKGEPSGQHDFRGTGRSGPLEYGLDCFRTLTPGTFRELKRLDVVSGEFEFMEEVKVPTLLETAINHLKRHWPPYNEEGTEGIRKSICQTGNGKTALALAEAIDRELSKPAPKYDEKLIDELLDLKGSGSVSFLLAGKIEDYTLADNRRAAEILQSLKRAKEEG